MISKSLLKVILRDKHLDLDAIHEELTYHRRKVKELEDEQERVIEDIENLEEHIEEAEEDE